VSLDCVKRIAFFAVPEGYDAIFISAYYLSPMVPPENNALLWLALHGPYALC